MNPSPVFEITQDFINSQGNLENEYHRQQKEYRVIKRIRSRIRRGEVLSPSDLRIKENKPHYFNL